MDIEMLEIRLKRVVAATMVAVQVCVDDCIKGLRVQRKLKQCQQLTGMGNVSRIK
jgi:hypothetical protein